jgi:hypothetical protein
VVVTEQGEPVIHNIGTGQIRIDKPLPPKVAAPVVQAAPAPAAEQAAPAPKRLTRLEQLRLDQEQRVKAQANGAANDAKPSGN